MEGIRINSSDGKILISTNTAGLHFHSKGRYISKSIVDSTFNGAPYSVTTSVLYKFEINNLYVAPMLFIKPAYLGEQYGLLRLYRTNSNTWEVYIIQHDHTRTIPPELYIFSTLIGNETGTGHGIRVYNSHSEVVYDSTKKPLGVVHSEEVIPPRCPAEGGPGEYVYKEGKNYYNSAFSVYPNNFSADSVYTHYPINIPVDINNVIFSIPTIAVSAVVSYYEGWFMCQYETSSRSVKYGARYYQTYAVTPTYIKAGWSIVQTASQFIQNNSEPGITFDGLLPTISSNDTNIVTGEINFNDTYNYRNTLVIVADSSLYDY